MLFYRIPVLFLHSATYLACKLNNIPTWPVQPCYMIPMATILYMISWISCKEPWHALWDDYSIVSLTGDCLFSCRWSSQNVIICFAALAYKGIWRLGIGNVLPAGFLLVKVMSEMSTSEKMASFDWRHCFFFSFCSFLKISSAVRLGIYFIADLCTWSA